MAPVSIMLNLRADALTAAQNSLLPVTIWCYSCPIDTALPTYPKWNKLRCTAWPNQLPS